MNLKEFLFKPNFSQELPGERLCSKKNYKEPKGSKL